MNYRTIPGTVVDDVHLRSWSRPTIIVRRIALKGVSQRQLEFPVDGSEVMMFVFENAFLSLASAWWTCKKIAHTVTRRQESLDEGKVGASNVIFVRGHK